MANMIQYFSYFSGHLFHCVYHKSIHLCFRYEFVKTWQGIFQYKSEGAFRDFFQLTDTRYKEPDK